MDKSTIALSPCRTDIDFTYLFLTSNTSARSAALLPYILLRILYLVNSACTFKCPVHFSHFTCHSSSLHPTMASMLFQTGSILLTFAKSETAIAIASALYHGDCSTSLLETDSDPSSSCSDTSTSAYTFVMGIVPFPKVSLLPICLCSNTSKVIWLLYNTAPVRNDLQKPLLTQTRICQTASRVRSARGVAFQRLRPSARLLI